MPWVVTSIGSTPGEPAGSRNYLRWAGLAVLLIVCVNWGGAAACAAEDETGQAIYKEECARCHGPSGNGTKKTTRPLMGEKSPSQLFAVIKRTMPDDDPGSCSDDEYQKVAAYIHDAFYSPDAQARLHPPRVELSHLTVGQYRGSVADLIGSFRPAVKLDGRHGLHGEYFNSKDIRGGRPLIDRLDPEVNFDFGTTGPDLGSDDGKPDGPVRQAQDKPVPSAVEGPVPSAVEGPVPSAVEGPVPSAVEGPKFNPDQFSIQWEGSVFAAETGDYELVVRTEHALRLWVNDPKRPVIDALVKSGQDTEYRTSLFLIAGRSYPLRLQVYKGRAVSDKKKGTPKPTRESVALLWKPPGRPVDEVVPSRCLSPVQVPEVAVIQTPFPPDDRSYGWERGTAVSKEWVAATTDAALDVAGYVAVHLPELAGASDDVKEREGKARAFCRSFAQRAFRRPLTDAQMQQLVDHNFDEGGDLDLAVKRSVIRVMIAPEFLYPDAASGSDGYAVASRLALVLWDSLPDQVLLSRAADGKLATHEQIAQQAQRMLDDPRARLKMRQFLLAWLRVDQPPELVKDPKKFPDFNPAIAADLRTSLELFLDDIASSDSADFRQLLLSDELFLNGRLTKFYGADLPPSTGSTSSPQAGSTSSPQAGSTSSPQAGSTSSPQAGSTSSPQAGSTSSPQAGSTSSPQAGSGQAPDTGFTKVKLDGQRAGVLTHPYMLATFAYPGESSPIHRGVFIIRGILGVTLRPPANAAFTPLPPESHPDLTTRERISLQTNQESCVGCHSVINPLGFALERFDAVGRHREMENAKVIDVSGHYETRAGPVAQFAGARELATFLADSDEAHDAFAQQMFQQFVKQPVRAYGLDEPKQLREIFAQSGYNIRKLLVEIAAIASQPR